ncbi:MAG: phosphatidylserine decarboxylase [Clostridiales bacterium]|jgi:phosphatidylserine decarboxylase|nr:phosphatidylserine decarboxylase [Clostridiales bacterium]
MIYDRKTGETAPEKVYKSRVMAFLYGTTLGGLCVLLLRLPVVSRFYGAFNKRKNEYFTRKEPRQFCADPNVLIAPADSCMLAFKIKDNTIFSVKGRDYALSKFLRDNALAKAYEGGTCLIFRLRVYDYHRFCHVDDGMIKSQKRVNGFLDSVNISATGRFTLSSNYRAIAQLETEHFGDIIFAEVGAMLVGRIVYADDSARFRKGDEKGYFELGGSSIVILLKKYAVKIDKDIWGNSMKHIETKVCYGERIGHAEPTMDLLERNASAD